jgi:hypothetical protein
MKEVAMTENYTPPYTSTPLSPTAEALLPEELAYPVAPDSGEHSSAPSAADVAKDKASDVAQGGVAAGQHVAEVAKDQAATVAAQAGDQVKDLLTQTRSELTAQAGQQQARIAQGLRALGDELHAMTQHDGQSGIATDAAHQGAERTQQLATWLDDRDPGSLIAEASSFARRKPGMFLLVALGTGVLAGRLTRGVKEASGEDSAPAADSGPTPPSAAGLSDDIEVARPYASSQDGPSGFVNTGSAE